MASLDESLSQALRDLRSGSPEARRVAHLQLVTAASEQRVIHALVQALDDTSWTFRSRLAQVLGDVGEEAAKELKMAVAHGVWYVRAAAAEALAAIEGEGAIEFLLPLLTDRAVGVRRAAIAGLVGNLTVERVPEFAEALQSLDAETRDPLLHALRKEREELYLEILNRRDADSGRHVQ